MKVEFDEYAESYSKLLTDPLRDGFTADPQFFHERKAILIREFFAQLRINTRSLQWLDVGCGQGQLLLLAGNEFGKAVGCDPSLKMIGHCEGTEVYEQRSPADLDFADSSFDFVTAVCVYHHVQGSHRIELTRSIHRVLRPGGIFCIIEHNPWNPATQIIVKRCPVDVDADLVSASTAARIVRSSGFDVLETVYFLYLPEQVFRYVGRFERFLRKLPLGGQFALFSQKSGCC